MELIRLWELGSRGRGWCMGIEDSLGRSECIELLPECLVVLLQLGKPSEERLESALKEFIMDSIVDVQPSLTMSQSWNC